MAPKRASKPGKTSRYYQSKKGRKSYLKQKRKQKGINSTAAKRRKHGIMGKGGKDVCHVKKGSNRTKLCSSKHNRAKGGAKRK